MAAGIVGHEYKVILLGESGVGKTSCFYRLKDGTFQSQTVGLPFGVEHLEHTVLVDGVEVKANVYDTAGTERFRTLTSNYFTNADAAILMFDVEDRISFDELHNWYETAMKHIPDPDNFVWAVVGNKSDLSLEIPQERISSKCKEIETELMFFTSAKTGENVREAFEAVILEVYKKSRTRKTRKQKKSIKLTKPTPDGSQTEKRGCCN